MSPFDLTNLAALKAWLGLPSAAGPNDATLGALITASSRSIYAALSRPSLLPQSYTDTIDLETRRVVLRQWPVLRVSSVTLCGNAVPQDTNSDLESSYGYALQPGDGIPPGRPQALDLFGLDCWLTPGLWGYSYRAGRQSLIVSYTAGYAVQNEAQTVPTAPPYQAVAFQPYGAMASDLGVTYAYPIIGGEAQTIPASPPYQLTAIQPLGAWAQDRGVSYASSGAPLTAVAGIPTTGQYSVSAGVYTFSAGNSSAAVLISYGYIPTAGAPACLSRSSTGRRLRGSTRSTRRPGSIRSPRRMQASRSSSRTALCRRIWRRPRLNWPPGGFAPPSASASGRSRWAARRQSPTT